MFKTLSILFQLFQCFFHVAYRTQAQLQLYGSSLVDSTEICLLGSESLCIDVAVSFFTGVTFLFLLVRSSRLRLNYCCLQKQRDLFRRVKTETVEINLRLHNQLRMFLHMSSILQFRWPLLLLELFPLQFPLLHLMFLLL